MRRLVITVVITLALGGCAQWRQAWDTLSNTQVTPTAVLVAGNTFDGLVPIATAYLRLKKCTGDNGPVCRDPVASAKIIKAVRSGRVARSNLETFFEQHPGTLGPKGLYDAFQASIFTLQGELVGKAQ